MDHDAVWMDGWMENMSMAKGLGTVGTIYIPVCITPLSYAYSNAWSSCLINFCTNGVGIFLSSNQSLNILKSSPLGIIGVSIFSPRCSWTADIECIRRNQTGREYKRKFSIHTNIDRKLDIYGRHLDLCMWISRGEWYVFVARVISISASPMLELAGSRARSCQTWYRSTRRRALSWRISFQCYVWP